MKLLIWTICIGFFGISHAQSDYWQQQVHYDIDVSLDDQKNALSGVAKIKYINNSPDTLRHIWFHLWPNAYRNDQTALARQLGMNRDKKKVRWEQGYIDSLRFTVDGAGAEMVSEQSHIDIVKVLLPKPLFPGASAILSTPFFVKLPRYFSRSGYSDKQYMICQWYPKPAVYDRKGWHPMPYLDQGEFYSDFGSFNVNITLPSEYVVGATGVLQTQQELDTYKQIGKANNAGGKTLRYQPTSSAATKSLNYLADSVHDFAWFANKNFVIRYDTLLLSSGNIIDVFSYGQQSGNKNWSNSTHYLESAVKHYSEWIGEYPYPTVAAVEGPRNQNSGGMEYPMITLITSPDAKQEALEAVIAHEVGHNWFYGVLASNERDHPWMDEGINTYFQFMYEAVRHRSNSLFGELIPSELKSLPPDEFLERIYAALGSIALSDPINQSSTSFTDKEMYGMVVYLKAATWMSILERSLGKEKLMAAMKHYYDEWKFRHPYPENFRKSIEESTGMDLSTLFKLLEERGSLLAPQKDF